MNAIVHVEGVHAVQSDVAWWGTYYSISQCGIERAVSRFCLGARLTLDTGVYFVLLPRYTVNRTILKYSV